jgi:predicted O-methyltransferase YrrM
MEHFYSEIHGWFDYQDLYTEIVRHFSDNSHFVEVGTWHGKSAIYMAVEIINSGKNIKFDCVDNWEYVEGLQNDIPKEDFNNIWEIFIKNIDPVKHIINPVKSISWNASEYYEDFSLDFVFIDAAHDYESVKKDIEAWYPKVKRGGIISGHDYYASSVRQAVHEYLKEVKSVSSSCWIHEKQ